MLKGVNYPLWEKFTTGLYIVLTVCLIFLQQREAEKLELDEARLTELEKDNKGLSKYHNDLKYWDT